MSRLALSGAALYSNEASFCEVASTFGTRLLPVNEIDVTGLVQEKVDVNPLRQRPHEAVQDVRTGFGGSFDIELLLTGHGGTTVGALTASDLYTLLVLVFGQGNAAQVGTTVSSSGSATAITTVGGTLVAGALCRVGAIADGRGGGEFYAVNSFSGTSLVLLNAMAAAASMGDVVYGALTVHPSEAPGTFETIVSTRWRLMTSNGQWICRGCYPTAVVISGTAIGEVPRIRITFGVAQWERGNYSTFPDATATNAKVGTPITAGKFWYNNTGTTTRQVVSLRSFELAVNFESVALTGVGGNYEYQTVVGARRTRSDVTLTATLDSDSPGTFTWDALYSTDERSLLFQHIALTMSAVDGKAVGLYMPAAKIITPRPTQTNVDGINRQTAVFKSTTGPTTTSDLTLSNFRLGMA